MKRTILGTTIMVGLTLLFSAQTYAQTTYWSLQGSSPTSTDYFGTTTNSDIKISTDNGGTTINTTKQKMIIKADGNVGIGYDGTNTPTTPANKFLLQNGSLNNNPYDNAYDLSMPASAIGLYSISIGAANNVNVPFFATAINGSATNIGLITNTGGSGSNNVGISNKVVGDGSNNIGVFSSLWGRTNATNCGYKASIDGDNVNTGLDVQILGDNAVKNTGASLILTAETTGKNYGLFTYISGDNADENVGADLKIKGAGAGENMGIRIFADDVAIDNTGIQIDVLNATNENLGVHIQATNSGIINTGIFCLASDASDINLSGNFEADGNGALNQGLYVDAQNSPIRNMAAHFVSSGSNNVQNSGVEITVDGDNSVSNAGIILDVTGSGSSSTGVVMTLNDNADDNTGVKINMANATNYNLGLQIDVSSATPLNTGIIATAKDATNENVGANIHALGSAPENTGVYATAVNGNTLNVGGHFIGESDNGTDNYGLIGDVAGTGSSNINYGIVGTQIPGTGSGAAPPYNGTPGGTPANFAGYFIGDVFSSDTYYYSDAKLKDNINDYNGALKKLALLPVKQYTFRTEQYPYMNMPQGERVGILSADLKKVFPNLVKESIYPGKLYGKEYVHFEAVNYNALIPVLVEAVKELDQQTTDNRVLERKVAALEKQIEQLNDLQEKYNRLSLLVNEICTTGCNTQTTNQQYGSLDVLYQNSPNPFDSETSIEYYLSKSHNNAYITVYSTSGVEIKKFENLTIGHGMVKFSANTLPAGTYIYYLFNDGIKVDTKKMYIITQ